jgi:hypothetical protein
VKAKRFVAILILVILLVSLVACGGGEGEAEPVEEIADAAVAAYAGLDTYRFDMDMTMEMDVTGGDDTVDGTVAVEMNSASDKVNQRAYRNMQVSADIPPAMEGEVEMYTMDDYAYLRTSMPAEPPTWLKWEICLPCGGKEKLDIVGQQADLLEDSIEVEVIDTDTLDATECYVLEVRPELEKLWEWMKEQYGIGERLPDLESDLNEVISDVSINQWIAKDTYYTLKSTIDITLTSLAWTLDITATVVVYDVNQPVNIELPPEAEDAEESGFPVPIFGPY